MEFDEGCQHIMAMKSLDGEVVPLKKKVQIQPEVEVNQLLMTEQDIRVGFPWYSEIRGNGKIIPCQGKHGILRFVLEKTHGI